LAVKLWLGAALLALLLLIGGMVWAMFQPVWTMSEVVASPAAGTGLAK